MRIAQVAPLIEAVPPVGYGGTERVVADLCDELVRRGHDVTLFATGDSHTLAQLEPMNRKALRRQMTAEQLGSVSPHLHLRALGDIYLRAAEFDVIHSHLDIMSLAFARLSPTPTITTFHGRLDLDHLRTVLSSYPELPLVSISHSQRQPLRDLPLNWVATVPNGIRVDEFEPGKGDGGYLAFLGRISPEKRPDLAVDVARRAGLDLRVAAKVDPVDVSYWEDRIKPLFAANHVDYLGEVDHAGKHELLAGAAALVFPIDWPEPFGLVMVEALACGTPVLALRRGSVPEIIRPGRGGFIADTVDELVESVGKLNQLDRSVCRSEAERFTVERMAQGYEDAYRQVVTSGARIPRSVIRTASDAVNGVSASARST